MDDGNGGFTLELQAHKIAENATLYKGSAPCPTCGIMVNPVEFMYNKGLCNPCSDDRRRSRVRGFAI
jgi:hypothetical protein